MEREIEDAVGAGRCRVPRRDEARHRTHGRLDRHQSLHGRLRLPARAAAGRRRRDPARDRAQRRGGRREQEELRAGAASPPSIRRTSRRSRSRRRSPIRSVCRSRSTKSIARRVEFLTAYQDAAYAKRYSDFVDRVRAAESTRSRARLALTEAVARYYFKLLAVKDEYEVARLYAETDFRERVAAAVRRRLQARLPPRAAAHREAGRRRGRRRRSARTGRG